MFGGDRVYSMTLIAVVSIVAKSDSSRLAGDALLLGRYNPLLKMDRKKNPRNGPFSALIRCGVRIPRSLRLRRHECNRRKISCADDGLPRDRFCLCEAPRSPTEPRARTHYPTMMSLHPKDDSGVANEGACHGDTLSLPA